MTSKTRSSDIDQLNSFLRGEISAVETYDQAIGKTDDPLALEVLRENQRSHANRVSILSAEITSLGGEPATGSGPWGAFAKAVEGGSKLLGSKRALQALEEGEDHGLKDYRKNMDDLTPSSRELVAARLLPEQQHTHDALSRLEDML